jgi:hypothetical protein
LRHLRIILALFILLAFIIAVVAVRIEHAVGIVLLLHWRHDACVCVLTNGAAVVIIVIQLVIQFVAINERVLIKVPDAGL